MNYRPLLNKRDSNGNKGTFGRVLVIAGNKGMSGCVFFSCMGAFRSGAGLVNILTTPENIVPLKIQIPEAIFNSIDFDEFDGSNESDLNTVLLNNLIEKADSIVIGPGLGTSENIYKLTKYVVENFDGNMVIDADSLNSVAKFEKISDFFNDSFKADECHVLNNKKNRKIIITPHILELSRLLGYDDIDYLKKNLDDISLKLSKEFNIIAVLKDSKTRVSDGVDTYINSSGNSSLSTAGSGDVLSGIIGALINNDEYTFRAVNTAVYLHGKAGELAGREMTEYSVMARDIIDYIPKAVSDLIKSDKYLGNAVIYEVIH